MGCSVRKQEDADRIAGEVACLPGTFVPLVFDVTDQEGISAAVSLVSEHLKGGKLGALINNAGKTLTHLGLLLAESRHRHYSRPAIHTACMLPNIQDACRFVCIVEITGRMQCRLQRGTRSSGVDQYQQIALAAGGQFDWPLGHHSGKTI